MSYFSDLGTKLGTEFKSDRTRLSTIENKLSGIEEGATADQTKEDIDALGIDASTVNGLSVETAVPANALFTDTTYTSSSFSLDGLSNTAITSNSNGEILRWDGNNWVNNTLTEAGIQPAGSYEPADSTILKDADIGVTVQGYSVNTVIDSNYAHITVTSSSVSDGSNTFNKYTHPTQTAINVNATDNGINVIDSVVVDTLGHVTSVGTRNLSAATTSASGVMSSTDKTKLDGIATSANNYSLPVASTSIGGVKSGTDITVDASGNVSVNDDSHNHIISNVDGLSTALSNKLETSLKGSANGIAELDATGKVPSTQLPAYVDDVLAYANLASFPATGSTGIVYIAEDTNVTYRWSGSTYVVIGSDLALGETSSTAYRGDRGKVAYDYSQVGHLPLVGGTINGNITITGTVDGRDVSADGTKLDGIAAGAQVNVATNLGNSASGTALTITSSTGSNTNLPAATTSAWGVMTDEDKTKLDGIAAGAQVNVATNLGYTTAASTGTVTSSTGNNATLPAATTSLAGLMTSTDKSKLDGIAASANNYSLPEATSSIRGGIELFSDTDQTVAANAVSATAGRTYGIQLNASGQAVVNVPWVDTNTDTTNFNIQANSGTQVNISAGEEVNFINGTYTTAVVTNQANPTVTFNHNSTSRTNNTSSASPAHGGTFTAIDSITTNTQGHVTAVNTKTVTLPLDNNTDTLQSIAANDTDADQYVTFVANASGAQTGRSDAGLVYNPNTNSLTVGGLLTATQKSFTINHPTKEGYKLRYGSLEGPENGVYVRGKLEGTNVIELPEYWTKLVDPSSITVQLTSNGKFQKLYVKDIKDNKVVIGNDSWFSNNTNCFYVVNAERTDVDKLVTEFKA